MELQRKKEAFSTKPIHVIAPSRWMASEAAASEVFASSEIHVIPYGVDRSIFSPRQIGDNFSAENSADEVVTLLFGCQALSEVRKGYREMQAALDRCMADSSFADAVRRGRIRLITFGSSANEDELFPVPVSHLGKLGDESQIAEVLRGASAFLCPTLDDNLPNVVMEALCCGCPVLGFATGGVPDMVEHGHNGLLAPTGDSEGLARLIISYSLDDEMRAGLRMRTGEIDPSKWSIDQQARAVLSLYEATAPELSRLEDERPKIANCPQAIDVSATIHPSYATSAVEVLLEENHHKQAEKERRVSHLFSRLEKEVEKKVQLKAKLSKLREANPKNSKRSNRSWFGKLIGKWFSADKDCG